MKEVKRQYYTPLTALIYVLALLILFLAMADKAHGADITETYETVQNPDLKNQSQTFDPVEQFVSRFYIYILERQPDAQGLGDWTANLKSGRETGADVGLGFVQSQEFIRRNLNDEAYIKVLYRAFFDREADEEGLQGWLSVLENGLSRMHVYKGFAQSAEFSRLCQTYGIIPGTVTLTEPRDQNENITKFITRCYKLCLDRQPDVQGLNQWCSQLLDGTNTPKEAVYGFVFSGEFKGKQLSNEDYIRYLYRILMDREADSAGLSDWLSMMDNGASREDIFNGFADSPEFARLCEEMNLPEPPLRIVLDPGHDDICARNHPDLGFNEQDLNLKIALACRDELMTYEGVQVFLTREDGSCPDNGIGSDDVTGRTAYAASVQGDVFISLHNNASGLGYPSSANGACAFVSVHSGYAEESKALAQSILDELTSSVDLRNLGVMTRTDLSKGRYPDGNVKDFYYLISSSVERGFPGIIIEHAFMDNPHDNALLKNDEQLKAMGIADATGIARYYNLTKR